MIRIITSILCALAISGCQSPLGELQHNHSTRSQAQMVTDYMPADGVLGQLSFDRSGSPILDAQCLYVPMAITRLGQHLVVADRNNSRVLGYAADPTGVLPDDCLLYTSPSPRDLSTSRMPSSA